METIRLLVKVFWSPGEAMLLLSQKPRVLAPLLFLCTVSLLSSLVVFSKIDMMQVMIRQAEQQGQTITEEQRANMARMNTIMTPVLIASATVGTALFITVAAAIYFGIFTIIGREGGFKTFYAITAFAFLPLVFRSVVSAIQAVFLPESSIILEQMGALNLAVFLDPLSVSKLTYAVASVVDIVSIWTAILLIIGFKFVTRKSVSTPMRATAVLSVYIVFSAIGVALRMLRPN